MYSVINLLDNHAFLYHNTAIRKPSSLSEQCSISGLDLPNHILVIDRSELVMCFLQCEQENRMCSLAVERCVSYSKQCYLIGNSRQFLRFEALNQ